MAQQESGSRPETLPYVPQDPEAFARNVGRAVEEGSRALAASLRPLYEDGNASRQMAERTLDLMQTLGEVGQAWLRDPARVMEAQARLWNSYMKAWNTALEAVANPGTQQAARTKPDRRFRDDEWNRNPVFAVLRDVYLATSAWAQDMVDEAEDIDPHTRQKARFYVEQIASALSPANFALTNPEVLRECARTNGENLARGLKMFAEDLEAGGGKLRLRQSSQGDFVLGENIATTPGKVVWRNAVCEVLQYEPATKRVLKRPLLVVPPWINKFYILDLTAEKSFIRWAIDQGHTVFVISWINPDERHAGKSFEHYVREGIFEALDVVEKATGERKVNAIGYCVGGTLLSFALAYLAARKEKRIATATLFTAQVDFTHAGDLKVFADERQIQTVEREMEEKGYLEGSHMANAFNMLRANDLIWPYVVNNYMKGKEPMPFDLLHWNSDATRMPCANHAYYLRNCYLENNLSQGRLEMEGVPLKLEKVKAPIYSLATREDHIAPARSVFHGCRFFGGDVTYVLAGSGHIAGVVNPPSKNKYQFWTGDRPEGELETWLESAKETPGSWWPHWDGWIREQDDDEVVARVPGGNVLPPLDDAPGTYVRMKA